MDGPTQCTVYDADHVEEIFATVERAMESAWVTRLDTAGVRIEQSDFDRPFLWFRGIVEAEDVPVAVPSRFIATSPQMAFSNFIRSSAERAELRAADEGDPDGLGRVALYDQTQLFFGYRIVDQRLYATRRLRDGTGVGLKMPADLIDGRWSTCRWEERFQPVVAFRAEATAQGSRFVVVYREKPTLRVMPFIPTSILSQVIVRIAAKIGLSFRRTQVARWQRAFATRPRCQGPRVLSFASGSAAAPRHLSAAIFSLSPLHDSPPSPFVVHAWALREPARREGQEPEDAPPPAPDTFALVRDIIRAKEAAAATDEPQEPEGGPQPAFDIDELFCDLIGTKEAAAASDEQQVCGRVPPAAALRRRAGQEPAGGPPPALDTNDVFIDLIGAKEAAAASDAKQDSEGGSYRFTQNLLVTTEAYMETPQFRSVLTEAMRASLDLSIRMEALSLGVSPPGLDPGPHPPPLPPDKGRARRRSDDGPSPDAEGAPVSPDGGPAQPPATLAAGEGPAEPPAKEARRGGKRERGSHRRKQQSPPAAGPRPLRPLVSKPAAPAPPPEPAEPPPPPRPPVQAPRKPKPLLPKTPAAPPQPPVYPFQPTAAGLPAGYYLACVPIPIYPAAGEPAVVYPPGAPFPP